MEDYLKLLDSLWPVFLGFITLVIVLAKMHTSIEVLRDKVRLCFNCITSGQIQKVKRNNMANLTQVTLQLIVKKLDQILKLLKLGRRSIDREEEEKTLNEHDIFSRPNNPEHEFMRKREDASGLHFNRTPDTPDPPKEEEKPKTSASQDKFNTAMHNVMKWVNRK